MQSRGGDMRIKIAVGELDMSEVRLGDSIAVSGVCLTVIEYDNRSFSADVSTETLARTALGQLSQGSRVNLEKALTLQTPLGGHLVSGHVDGIGEVVSRSESGRAIQFQIKAPDALARYMAEKGSICVDGISLTINAIQGATFDLTIVPHTLDKTVMDEYQPGRKVNLEVDIVARYLERLLLGDKAANKNSSGITLDMLKKNGFLS
jgi:riboflavin synthase